MSADWFYMKIGFFGSKNVGPIAESDFLHNIEKGLIKPETLVCSTTKTHGHWIHLRDIRAGMQVWDKTHPADKKAV